MEGVPPRKGGHIYFSTFFDVMEEDNLEEIKGKWVVERVDYGVRIFTDPISALKYGSDYYKAEVFLVRGE